MGHLSINSLPRTTAPVLVASTTESGVRILGQDGRYNHVTRRERADRLERYERSVQVRSQQVSRVQARPHLYQPELNPVQLSMYRRVFYGLKQYSATEMAGMDRAQLERVAADHRRGTYLLHRLKVDAYLGPETKLLNAIWPRLQLGTKPTDYRSVKLPTEATLARLRIGVRQIVACFVDNGLLPMDFWDLTPAGIRL